MKKNRLANIALNNLRASAKHSWSYLCEGESFGFFLWEWSEDCGIERGDKVSALEMAQSGEHGVAWLVPIAENDQVEGVALFTGHAGNAAEDEPVLEGVFKSEAEARAYLKTLSVIDERSPKRKRPAS